MSVKEFAEKFIKAENEAIQRGNFAPLKALEDPNVIYHVPPLPDMVGHEAHKQDILDARRACSDIKLEWKYLTGRGNICALSHKSSGRFINEKPGLTTPVGKDYTANYLFVLRLNKARIAEVWAYGSITVSD